MFSSKNRPMDPLSENSPNLILFLLVLFPCSNYFPLISVASSVMLHIFIISHIINFPIILIHFIFEIFAMVIHAFVQFIIQSFSLLFLIISIFFSYSSTVLLKTSNKVFSGISNNSCALLKVETFFDFSNVPFVCPASDKKYSFWENLVQKIKTVCSR